MVAIAGIAWVVFTAWVTRQGYVHSDMARMAVFIAQIAEPGRYPTDYLFANSAAAAFYAPVMTHTLAFAMRLTGSLSDGQALVFGILMALYLPGALALFRLLSGRWSLAIPLAFLTSLPYGLAQDVAVFWGIKQTIAQTFYNALAPSLIAFLLWVATRPREEAHAWGWAALGLALGLSANVHPQSAIMLVALTVVTALALLAWGRVDWRLPLWALPGVLLGALPYLLTFLGGAGGSVSPQDWQEFLTTLNIRFDELRRLRIHLRGYLPPDLTAGFLWLAVPIMLFIPARVWRRRRHSSTRIHTDATDEHGSQNKIIRENPPQSVSSVYALIFTRTDLLLALVVAFFAGLVVANRTFSGALFLVLWGYWLYLFLWRRPVEWIDALLLIWLVAIIFGADVVQRLVHYAWVILPGNKLIFGLDYEFWRTLLFVYAPLFGFAARWAGRMVNVNESGIGVGTRHAVSLPATDPDDSPPPQVERGSGGEVAAYSLAWLLFLFTAHNRVLSFSRADFLFNEDWAILSGIVLLMLLWPLYGRLRRGRFGSSLDVLVWGVMLTLWVVAGLRIVGIFQSPAVLIIGLGIAAVAALIVAWEPSDSSRRVYRATVIAGALIVAAVLWAGALVDTKRLGDDFRSLREVLIPDEARLRGAWEFAGRDPLTNPGGLYAWARDETPPDARFLYPQEDCVWFRYYTGRSLVACTVDTFNTMYSHGVRGFLDVYHLNEAALAAYDSPGALAAFASEHGADYIVTRTDWPGALDYPLVYEDEQFRVYVVGE